MKTNDIISVTTGTFSFELNASRELRALRWHNHLADKVMELGGRPELEVEVDTALQRIWIEGWHYQRGDKEAVDAGAESGFLAGYHLPDYPDVHEHLTDASQWPRAIGVFGLMGGDTFWAWARARLFLPESLKGEPITFILGGFGVGDFRHTRAFINGALFGERKVEGRWFEPGTYKLWPNDPIYQQLRFGQINILALQLGGVINRALHHDAVDPTHSYHWPYPQILQPAYFQHLEAGEQTTQKLSFTVRSHARESGPDGEILHVTLEAEEKPVKAELTYRPSPDGRTLIKSVKLTNLGGQAVSILNLRLGDYETAAPATEGDMGFPVYADESFFLSLDHPAGWAMGEKGRVQLRQFPGAMLHPGQTYSTMNAVLGVSEAGHAREAFLNYLQPRMRRVCRGHDKPYAISSMYGSWEIGPDEALGQELSEEVCLHHSDWLSEFRRKTGEEFDTVSVDFWNDPTADLVKFNRLFPHGFEKARQALTATGVNYGLWIDSSAFISTWNIGLNPLLNNCHTGTPSGMDNNTMNPLCRAAEPFRSIMDSAFGYHVREKGARLLKFDNLASTCHNQNHGHLPGVYSVEAIYNSVIDFFASVDRTGADVFLMLYWGYRSPWWLLHGDTLFECGLMMEASSPSPLPSLYIRDGVTVTLDQAVRFISDVPRLGKDSLGVWLSKWPWNSSIGAERWQEGVIMDLCRGNLLFQPWMGEEELSDEDLHDMAGFLRLLRRQPKCFAHPRLILGDPWHNEPYGYVCSDGTRAFVAVNNFSWNDLPVALDQPADLDLDPAGLFTVFRHYPEPAELSTPGDCLRPFQVALYELVPVGQRPSSDTAFPVVPPRQRFLSPTETIALEVKEAAVDISPDERTISTGGIYEESKESRDKWRGFTVSGRTLNSISGGMLVVTVMATRDARAVPTGNMASFFKADITLNGEKADARPVLPEKTYPATWQAWRIDVPAVAANRPFDLKIACRLGMDIKLDFCAYFIPGEKKT